MDFLTGTGSKPQNPVNVQVAPSAGQISKAGTVLEDAVKTAKQVSEGLNVAAQKLREASNTLKKSSPAVEGVVADAATDPRLAGALAPVVGGANAAILRRLPRSVVTGGVRMAVHQAAGKLNELAAAATQGAKAVDNGLKDLAKGANWVAANAKKIPFDDINNYVHNNANYALNGSAQGVNSFVGANVLPPVNLKSNLGPTQAAAVARVARNVAKEASRKNRKNVTRKNGRKGATRKDRKNRKDRK
jgi:hypothetical protein